MILSKGSSHRKINVNIADIVIVIIITLLCLTCILPFVHIAAKSISSNTMVLSKSVYLVPKEVTFSAYLSIFKDGTLTNSMVYTVYMTAIFTVLGMIITICGAYPTTKKRLKGRNFFTYVMLFTLYFSAGLIPEYLLMKKLGLLNTMWVLVLPLMFSPYNMLIMKSYLQSTIHESLEESAFLDGATDFQILFRIVLPLSKLESITGLYKSPFCFSLDIILRSVKSSGLIPFSTSSHNTGADMFAVLVALGE
jgi:putative aldouronate transport system permease protein